MMPGGRGRPVLVTGLPRSGTSWVGKMLELGGDLVYVNEPLNPGHPPGRSPGVLDADVTHRFQYICEDNESSWLTAFQRTVALRYGFRAELSRNRGPYDLARMLKYAAAFEMGRRRGRRALLDDPFALFSTAWFSQRLGCRSVVLVRDPVAFVGSWRRLGWRVHFHELLEQPLLMRDHLEPHADEMRSMIGSPDWLARSSLLWRLAYGVVDSSFRPLPGVEVIRYEDLAADPITQFERLFVRLGLTWNPRVREDIGRATTSNRADDRASHTWSLARGVSRTAFRPMDSQSAAVAAATRLTASEASRVRELTGSVATALGYKA